MLIPPIVASCSSSVYKLSEISFKVLAEIPRHLLESIARCFCQKVEVCRKCFYGDRSLSSWLQGENMCSLSLHKWMNPIFVIPGEGVEWRSVRCGVGECEGVWCGNGERV